MAGRTRHARTVGVRGGVRAVGRRRGAAWDARRERHGMHRGGVSFRREAYCGLCGDVGARRHGGRRGRAAGGAGCAGGRVPGVGGGAGDVEGV